MKIDSVLLVDDEGDIRSIGAMSLESLAGWKVVQSPSGADALRQVRSERPDLILLDVMMPGMDGPTTLEKIRQDPALSSIPIIFLTAKVQPSEVERYMSIGASGVIRKPFDPMMLADEIREIVAESKEESQ